MTTGTPTRTVAGSFRAAFLANTRAAIGDTEVAVVTGHPSPQMQQAFDIVSVSRVSSEQEPKTMGPRRQFEETLKQEVIVSVYRPGGDEADQAAVDRAFELLGQIEHAMRFDDTTVGGTVLWCWRTAVEFDTDPAGEDATGGRVCELSATFTAMVRIIN